MTEAPFQNVQTVPKGTAFWSPSLSTYCNYLKSEDLKLKLILRIVARYLHFSINSLRLDKNRRYWRTPRLSIGRILSPDSLG